MPEIFTQESGKAAFRALVLCGVLAGLLFSCGEGIRLFPFPPAAASFTASSGWKTGSKINYQKNAPRFENKKENSSKLKRDDLFLQQPAGGSSYFKKFASALTSFPALFSESLAFSRPPFNSILIAQSGGSRPPPSS